MVKSKSMHGAGSKATRKNTHEDRMSGGLWFHASTKKQGAGKGNWGRLVDEDTAPLDQYDPAYDSADELFEKAFGGKPKNTQFDWGAVQDLSEEDNAAMNEIEDAMQGEWMRQLEKESSDIEDEAEAFFG